MYNYYLDEKLKKQKIVQKLDEEERKVKEEKHKSIFLSNSKNQIP